MATLPQYYDFLNAMVTLIPTARNLNPFILKFYYLVDLSPNGVLQADAAFQGWIRKLLKTGVTLIAEVGAALSKGEEFGFSSFGGSDIVTLFEAGKVRLDAKVGTHYNQGRQIGHAVNGEI